VPYRPLVPHPDKSVGTDSENLIIHGDNLHALKALLPRYAGKVDLIFIDPPYNTGKEDWGYNDNVNSPLMKEWLTGNPVNKDDMLRHDKWACMMWPRLRLLHELLADHGSFWMTLDDNEIHHARTVVDELFGEDQFAACVIWQKMDSPSRNDEDRAFSRYHDYVLAYVKDSRSARLSQELRQSILDAYPLKLDDGRLARRRQLRKNGKNARREDRPSLWYKLKAPDGRAVWPVAPDGWDGRWVLKKSEWKRRAEQGLTKWIRRKHGWVPYYIEVAPAVPTAPWSTIWTEVDQNRQAQAALTAIMKRETEIKTPKPVNLISRILSIGAPKDGLILDSFAGSGTTAHAVLAQNAKDGGSRKFILVEGQPYADGLTAERVRRVVNGYSFKGRVREVLHREKLTWTRVRKADDVLGHVASIENLDGPRFDKIRKEVKNGNLIVTGERKVTQKAEGLGGGFTYCTLGNAVDLDDMLSGKSLPSYAGLGSYLFHTATGRPMDAARVDETSYYLGESPQHHVWLIYRPDLAFLKSREGALTLEFAERIAQRKDKQHLVFAPTRYVPNKTLLPMGVEYAPLPYALYRIEKD
jgi:adenine-specific DNA-methyltransferase